MQKRIGLMLLLACFLLFSTTIIHCYSTGTLTLYYHSEEISDARAIWWLKSIACDGTAQNLTAEGDEEDCVPLMDENSSLITWAYQFGDVSRIMALTPSNWVFHFRAIANQSEAANLTVAWWAIYDNATFYSGPDHVSEWSWLDDHDELITPYVTTSWSEVDVTANFNETVSVDPTDWLLISVSALFSKNDTSVIVNVDNPIDCSLMCTKITGIGYDTLPALPGSTYWNPTVLAIWQIVLPLMFVIGASVLFITYREKKISLDDVIVVAIALLLFAILIPVGLNLLYSA